MQADSAPTDTLLLRIPGPEPDWPQLHAALERSGLLQRIDGRIGRCAWSPEAGLAYLYVELAHRLALPAGTLSPLLEAAGPSARIARLVSLQECGGASPQADVRFHYAVEMTPEAGWEIELQRWYQAQHLPGLAAVPGCVRARRLWNHDEGPRSFACYDLASRDTMGSPPWLAVRNTDWSSRVRPHFQDTTRTFFTVPPLPARQPAPASAARPC